MDFFASTYNTRGQDGGDSPNPPRPSHPRRSHSISFPHYCPQQQGYGYQSDPLLRRTSQGLSESSLSPTIEEPPLEPGYSEDCQFDSATLKVPRSPHQRSFSHHLSHYSTAPDLTDHLPSSMSACSQAQTRPSHGGQYHSYYVSNPCLSHHVNASGYGSVQRPSLQRGHKKSYSHHSGQNDTQASIPMPADCVPQTDKTGKCSEEEACRFRNSQQMLQDADATVSSKGRLFPTSQYMQHLHQYLRKLHSDVKDNAARLMAQEKGAQGGGPGSPPPSSTVHKLQSPAPRHPTDFLSAPEVVARTPSPLTAQAMATGGMNDLPDSTQDIYAALASPAESYTLQRRMSQYGYSDPTLLAKLSLKDGESKQCIRINTSNPQDDPYGHPDIVPQPDTGGGTTSPTSPILEVAKTAVRDRLHHSSYAVGSPTLSSPPFSPELSKEGLGTRELGAMASPPRQPAVETRPMYGLSRRQSSFTGFSEGPGMELYPAQDNYA